MRTSRTLAIGAFAAAFGAGLLGAVYAQTQGTPPVINNPTINTCNTTPDTNAGETPPPPKVLPTPIVPKLLTSGQPCQQVVSGKGLTSDALANLQRGFDFYSWLTFIALNSPIDGKVIGQGPRPGGDAMTQWESIANYRPLADVMLPNGAKPTWGTRIVPPACQRLDGPGKIILVVGEEAWNQPFKTGPLIDQDGHYALFDILMNKVMFDYIADNNLYSKQGQEQSNINPIAFPEGKNLDPKKNPGPGQMGAVMVKVSWRLLDRAKDDLSKFHTADALIYFPGPPHTQAGPACIERTLGLIGFHVGHKTFFAPQWVWTSFEQVANVPDRKEVNSGKPLPLPRYSFYKVGCDKKDCPENLTPPDPWPPKTDLKFHDPAFHSQIVREDTLPPFTADIPKLNESFRGLVKGTVWENYMLVATQWPSDHANPIDPTGVPAPTYLANTTLETYSQGDVPLASSSCMACHGNATDQHKPALPSDFTFILEKAQSQTAAK